MSWESGVIEDWNQDQIPKCFLFCSALKTAVTIFATKVETKIHWNVCGDAIYWINQITKTVKSGHLISHE